MKGKNSSLEFNEISKTVNGFLGKSVSEETMSEWIEDIYQNGMTTQQSADYTKVIIDTGERLDFSSLSRPVVDKHSTGGVGDKVSLILGPLLAAYGFHVPMIVGRSLGHTGGTLDKLCSIPGYKPYLSLDNFKKNVKSIGVSIMGQTDDICPGDRVIYALRDKLDRIDSYPLICGSIMSKKIAEGIQGLVLDIKTGNGAFMQTQKMAQELGALLSDIGRRNGVSVKVVISDMSQPLGNFSGVGCEVHESILALRGEGPQDLMDLVFYLAKKSVEIFDENCSTDKLKSLIESGLAYEKFDRMISAHGGSLRNFSKMRYDIPKFRFTIKSSVSGYIKSYRTKEIGELLSSIGAGRMNNKDGIDNFAGLRVYKKIGDQVFAGEKVLEFSCSSEQKINNLSRMGLDLFKLSESSTGRQKLIYK